MYSYLLLYLNVTWHHKHWNQDNTYETCSVVVRQSGVNGQCVEVFPGYTLTFR